MVSQNVALTKDQASQGYRQSCEGEARTSNGVVNARLDHKRSTGSVIAIRIAPGQAIPTQEVVTLEEIAAKMATVAGNANDLIVQVQGELGGISTDARALLANLNSVITDERPKIDHIADQLLALSRHADGVVAKVGPVVDHADSAIQNVNSAIGEVREPIRVDLAAIPEHATASKRRSVRYAGCGAGQRLQDRRHDGEHARGHGQSKPADGPAEAAAMELNPNQAT